MIIIKQYVTPRRARAVCASSINYVQYRTKCDTCRYTTRYHHHYGSSVDTCANVRISHLTRANSIVVGVLNGPFCTRTSSFARFELDTSAHTASEKYRAAYYTRRPMVYESRIFFFLF